MRNSTQLNFDTKFQNLTFVIFKKKDLLISFLLCGFKNSTYVWPSTLNNYFGNFILSDFDMTSGILIYLPVNDYLQ